MKNNIVYDMGVSTNNRERSDLDDNLQKHKGDYQIPDLTLPEMKQTQEIGKYGLMRLDYLKKNKKTLYSTLLMSNQLTKHLIEIDNTATMRVQQLIEKMKKKENITEKLKQDNQMEWVGKMNNLKLIAEELVKQELIMN